MTRPSAPPSTAVLVLACVLVMAAAAGAQAASTNLQAGYYTDLHYVLSASVSGSGQCQDAAGTYFSSVTYYPGAAKAGFTDWRPFNTASFLGEGIGTFPVTQAAGVATWSGAYTTTIQPGNTKVKGSFTSTTNYADAHSSASTATFTYPVTGGGTCTTTEQTNLVPTGK